MADNSFFDESREQSVVKATIVSKYFTAWARVIIPSTDDWARRSGREPRIAYIDLFAGPGRYKDGTASTPLLVLQRAIEDTEMQKMLVAIFNDKDSDNSRSLEREISMLPGVDALAHQPVVNNHEVGEKIVTMFEEMNLVPTLFFVDPWGYKGLSLRLVNSVLKNWGCDCIFFFNYNRINMGLNNPFVREHMDALFGERSDELRRKMAGLSPYSRELTIVEELSQALRDMGGNYVLPFGFRNEAGTRTSHHLIFVSKHFRGYEIMKQIMATESSRTEQGVPSLEYNPADERYPMLFEVARPLDDLGDMLLEYYAGRTKTLGEIYSEHNIGRRYIKKNYKDILRQLESEGRVTTEPPASQRPRRKGEVTFADHVKVTFPSRERRR